MNESISMVIPVYNEEKNIAHVVSSVDGVLKSMTSDYEIILIESGSTDNSRVVIDNLLKQYKNLKAHYQGAKKGYGNALREGFSKAKKDIVVYTDSDNPLDLSELKDIIPQVLDYDALIGVRYGKRESLKRIIFSRGYKVVVRALFNLWDIKDINFSFKIIKKDMLEKLNLMMDGWFIDTELLVELKKNNAKINQIPIRYIQREKGKSNVGCIKTTLGLLKEIYQYKKYRRCPKSI